MANIKYAIIEERVVFNPRCYRWLLRVIICPDEKVTQLGWEGDWGWQTQQVAERAHRVYFEFFFLMRDDEFESVSKAIDIC